MVALYIKRPATSCQPHANEHKIVSFEAVKGRYSFIVKHAELLKLPLLMLLQILSIDDLLLL